MLANELLIFVVFLLGALVTGQQQSIRFLFRGQQNTAGSTLSTNVLQSSTITTGADRVCVRGLWALYDKALFGAGQEEQTTAVLANGINPRICSPHNNGILPNIQSFRFLGNNNIQTGQLNIFSEPNFIGADQGVQGITTTGGEFPRGVHMGSLAITGERNVWQLCPNVDCNPVSSSVCIDSHYFGPLYAHPNTESNNWPQVIRAIRTDISDPPAECIGAQTPMFTRFRLDPNETTISILPDH